MSFCVCVFSYPCELDKKHFKKDRESASYQEHKPKYTSSTIPSVKDRSALYLSKVAAADSSGYIEQQVSAHCICHITHNTQASMRSSAQTEHTHACNAVKSGTCSFYSTCLLLASIFLSH